VGYHNLDARDLVRPHFRTTAGMGRAVLAMGCETGSAGDGAGHAIGSAPAVRDLTLDLVKGVLVVGMVVYHAMNVFSTAGPDEYAYVRFISGSFILMSGYIVAKFYKTPFERDWRGTSRGLVVRGLKLLILFTFLNLLFDLTGIGNPEKIHLSISVYMDTLIDIYAFGKPGLTSFQILLPIAYLLIAAPILLMLGRLSKWLFVAFFTITLAPWLLALDSVNLDFALIGVIGLSGGMLMNTIGKPFAMKSTWTLVSALLASAIFMKYLSVNLTTYALGTMIILKLLYDVCKRADLGSRLARLFISLGQYSLVCYIAQIAFMQALHQWLLKNRWPLGYETMLVVLATVIFMMILSAGLSIFRDRYRFVARAYKLIFL
jgi:hypothetical protein